PIGLRRESETYAEFLELDGDRDGAAARLRDRNRKLTSGEEARFLAALGYEIRLREAVEHPSGLQRLDDGAELVLGAEQEQIQVVAEHQIRPDGLVFLAEEPRSQFSLSPSGP